MSRYVTLSEFKNNNGIEDPAAEVEAQLAIDAAEESLENWCSRRFYADADVNSVRFYTADGWHYLKVDDLVSLTSLKTDEDGDATFETTWATSDRVLWPYNAAQDGKPYTELHANALGSRVFPRHVPRGVEVTGKFGWPAVPDAVKQATMIQATRFFKRSRTSAFGIETVTIDGSPVRIRSELDADVRVMLSRLRKVVVA